MAESPIALRIISALCLLTGAVLDDASLEDLYRASYECKLDSGENRWKIQCESGSIKNGSKFLVAKLQGSLSSVKKEDFNDLLNSSSILESELYSCDIIMRAVIQIDPLSVATLCTNLNEYIGRVVDVLQESDISSLKIAHASDLDTMLHIFQQSSNLTEVIIYNTSLSNFTVFPFYPNNSISNLILKLNNFQQIPNNAFRKFPALKTLDLSENNVSYVNKTSFNDLRSILDLDLSFNHIETIPNDTFSNMAVLEKLYLQNNNLKHLDENIFDRNKLLKVVDVSNNDLKILPPKLFHHLSELNNISCSNCSLNYLDMYMFMNSPKLQYVMLQFNHIQVIPVETFRNLKYLRYLDLAHNSIKELSIDMFQYHSYLRILKLEHNEIRSLKNGLFDNARNINMLDLSNNKIEVLTDEHVKMFYDLEWIKLSNNKIVVVELGIISEEIRIRRLSLDNNLITNLNINWKNMIYLEYLEADSNLLTSLALPPCIPSIKQTITFSLKNNKISSLNLDSLISDELRVQTDRKLMMGCFFNGMAKNFVDLTNNLLICDCHLYPFYKYMKDKVPRKYQLESFLNKGNLTCAGPHNLNNETIMYLKDDSFSCQFTENCPIPCTCGIRGMDGMTFVNCSGHNLTAVPKNVPESATVLYFNKNKLISMDVLNGNPWNNFKEFHLDDNILTSLSNWNFPDSLVYLSVRGNKLKNLPLSLMDYISNQTDFQLYFGDNDRNCTCDREELKIFLTNHKKFVMDVDDVICEVTNNGTAAQLPLISVPDSELCPPSFDALNYRQKVIVISLCLFFTLLITVLSIYYRQRQLILSFFYIHCDILYRLCFAEEEYDDDKIFDAFIAYSSTNRDIVMDILEELENHPPYFKLCIHERNWLPGQFICDNILSSVQSSKRIIILLSDAFMTSRWFNLELRAAVSKMSEDKINRIIVILTEKTVSLTNVDPELRHVISKRTYLVWKERWFWEKLRYAMPKNKRQAGGTLMLQPNKRTGSELSLIPKSVYRLC